MSTSNQIDIEVHLPERRRRTEIRMCHGSACCSCCCLHTAGGIIGAAVAPAFGKNNRIAINYYYDEELDSAAPNVAKTGISAVKLFWLLSLASLFLAPCLSAALQLPGVVGGFLIVAFVFPAVQLGCALVTLICMAASSRPDKSFQVWQVGKIMLGLVVGAGAGIMTMVAIRAMTLPLENKIPVPVKGGAPPLQKAPALDDVPGPKLKDKPPAIDAPGPKDKDKKLP